ncbi:MAG: ABC transporter ATP-binding protein [Caldilineaceae bacterium]
MTQPIIEATEVQKRFRTGEVEVHALRGVDLSVEPGEMVAIMGPSGCGKTTLLNCLSGLDEFDSGSVKIEGTDLRKMNDRTRTRYRAQRMGFIFQTFNLLPVISALENVELPLLVSGVSQREARQKAVAALDQVGLADRARHRPAELSGGQRQRVTIARALVNNPAIVWADEPTGNLDSKTANDVLDLMKKLNHEQGQTFIIVTHDAGIGAACDRIVHMQDGEIVNRET